MVTINLKAGKSIRKVELERKTVGRNLLDENRVKVGKRQRKGEKDIEKCMVEIKLKSGLSIHTLYVHGCFFHVHFCIRFFFLSVYIYIQI